MVWFAQWRMEGRRMTETEQSLNKKTETDCVLFSVREHRKSVFYPDHSLFKMRVKLNDNKSRIENVMSAGAQCVTTETAAVVIMSRD